MRGTMLVVLAWLLVCLAPGPSLALSGAHRLVTLELDGDSLQVLASQRVALPLPSPRGGPGRPVRSWRARLLDGRGEALHVVGLEDPTELRVEFPDDQGRIHAQRVRRSGPVVFCVRLPLAAGRLALERLDPAGAKGAGPAEGDWLPVAEVALEAVAP